MVNADNANQFLLFENCNFFRRAISTSRAGVFVGQLAQTSFVNCSFDAPAGTRASDGGINVEMAQGNGNNYISLIKFITCTFQNSDVGVKINSNCRNISLDTCWFENLNKAVVLGNSVYAIDIKGCRFTNAGYDAILTVGASSSCTFDDNNMLGVITKIFDADSTNRGIKPKGNIYGTTASIPAGLTTGCTKQFSISSDGIIETFGVRTAIVSTSASNICTQIKSDLLPGDEVTLKAVGTSANKLTFQTGGNLNLGGNSQLSLTVGQSITFIRMDRDGDYILKSVTYRIENQANSNATDVDTLRNALNNLLQKLRDAGIMY